MKVSRCKDVVKKYTISRYYIYIYIYKYIYIYIYIHIINDDGGDAAAYE